MAVTAVNPISAGRTGDVNDEFRHEYEKVFRVFVNSSLDEQATVIGAVGIPVRHSVYADLNGRTDPFALCMSVTAHVENDEDWQAWICTARFNTDIWDRIRKKGGENQQNQQPENPVLEPPDISIDTQDGPARVLDTDLKGVAVVNSAGERFSPGREVNDTLIVLTIQKNEATSANALALRGLDFYNAVNSDFFFGFRPGYVKCKGIKGASVWKDGQFYFKVVYVFHIVERVVTTLNQNNVHVTVEGWAIDEGPIDHGRRQILAGKLVDIISATGVPVEDAYLNGSNGALLNGTNGVPDPAKTNAPVCLLSTTDFTAPRFQFYKRKQFADLNLF